MYKYYFCMSALFLAGEAKNSRGCPPRQIQSLALLVREKAKVCRGLSFFWSAGQKFLPPIPEGEMSRTMTASPAELSLNSSLAEYPKNMGTSDVTISSGTSCEKDKNTSPATDIFISSSLLVHMKVSAGSRPHCFLLPRRPLHSCMFTRGKKISYQAENLIAPCHTSAHTTKEIKDDM